jgi:hypothetical protein
MKKIVKITKDHCVQILSILENATQETRRITVKQQTAASYSYK